MSSLPVFKGSTCSLTSMMLSLITISNHTRLFGMAAQSEKPLDLFLVYGEAIVHTRDPKSFHHRHLTALFIGCRPCVQWGEKSIIPPEPSRALWFNIFGL